MTVTEYGLPLFAGDEEIALPSRYWHVRMNGVHGSPSFGLRRWIGEAHESLPASFVTMADPLQTPVDR